MSPPRSNTYLVLGWMQRSISALPLVGVPVLLGWIGQPWAGGSLLPLTLSEILLVAVLTGLATCLAAVIYRSAQAESDASVQTLWGLAPILLVFSAMFAFTAISAYGMLWLLIDLAASFVGSVRWAERQGGHRLARLWLLAIASLAGVYTFDTTGLAGHTTDVESVVS